MNRTEKNLWKKLKTVLPGAADRMENTAGTGFPDVYGDSGFRSYWVEMKVASTQVASDGTKALKLLRPTQVVWLRRHVSRGATCLLAVGHTRGVVFYKVLRVGMKKIIEFSDTFSRENKLLLNAELRQEIEHG